jgi:S-adenosylmethionine decarboxylase
MRALSLHTLLEFYGCAADQLKRTRQVKALLHKSVLQGGGTIVKEMFHNFSPYGVSGVIVITESHVTIHTWPEHGYAAVDIFSCSEKLDHAAIRNALESGLSAARVESKSFSRGPRSRKGSPAKIPAFSMATRARLGPKKS